MSSKGTAMPSSPQVAVVGAGIIGLCTARALEEQGADVTVYERRTPGADQSAGPGRIFRHAHDDPRLVELAHESGRIWRAWSEQLDVPLVSDDGAVAIGPSVDERFPVLEAVGDIAARRIASQEVAAALPILAGFDGPAMLDEDAGAIDAEAAIAALAARVPIVAEEVLGLRPDDDGTVGVLAGGVRRTYDHVVVCAGRGTTRLARGLGLTLPVRVGVQVRSVFAVRGAAPARLACLQDSSGVFGESSAYGTPLPGNRAYAVGLTDIVEVDQHGALPADEVVAVEERITAYVRRALPGLEPAPTAVRRCWTTTLPWTDDAVAVWQRPGVTLVVGHHLFKHAAALGRALAEAAVGAGVRPDLHPESRLGQPPGG
jgi:sarcosine oxidase